jgi:mannose-6-phosphate isomerase-like protein (cupin superfamily)
MEKKLVIPLRDALTGPMGDGMGTFRIFIDEEICGSKSFSFLVNTMNKGKKGPDHTHDTESCFYILSGKGIVRIKDESFAVSPQTAVFVPKDALHKIEADPGEDLTYIMIYAPPGPEKQLRNKSMA